MNANRVNVIVWPANRSTIVTTSRAAGTNRIVLVTRAIEAGAA